MANTLKTIARFIMVKKWMEPRKEADGWLLPILEERRVQELTANFIIVGTREKSRDFRRASLSFCKKYNNSENFSTQTEFQTI